MLDNKKKGKRNNFTYNNTHENILSPTNAPDALANLTTGMDLFQIDIEKLVNAPSEWNFYRALPDDKMEELVNSIKDKGLLHALVVWDQDNGTYMILSGHNRKKAIEQLYKDTQNQKYKKIHCYVKKKAQLNDTQAQGIIIDTNWVQRILTLEEKSQSIFRKYAQIKKLPPILNSQGEVIHTRDNIADQLAISGRQVSNYMRLNYLVPSFKEMISSEKINIKSGVKLSYFPDETQQWIYDNFVDVIDNKNISTLNKEMTNSEIDYIFKVYKNKLLIIDSPIEIKLNKCFKSQIVNKNVKNIVIIPIDKQKEFSQLVIKFLKELK